MVLSAVVYAAGGWVGRLFCSQEPQISAFPGCASRLLLHSRQSMDVSPWLCFVTHLRLYEEVEPGCILDTRTALEGEGKEYLVQYKVSGRGVSYRCAVEDPHIVGVTKQHAQNVTPAAHQYTMSPGVQQCA